MCPNALRFSATVRHFIYEETMLSVRSDLFENTKINYSDINFTFQVGSRQGSRLIYSCDDNQLYCKNKKLTNGDTTYTCRIKSCKARVYLSEDETRVFSCEDHLRHSHGAQDSEIKKIIAIEEIKNRCKLTNTDLKQVFNEVMAEYTQEGDEIKISYDNCKRTLQRKRKEFGEKIRGKCFSKTSVT
ncbi:uncharacterized protein [Drosophila suzukii]|uniref:Uncharacterized protein isoform X2 n=1 Tax=Drosophila suzukii TaxID=28584 RepID=A0ABM4TUL1_DROSZ